jgi:hypothetical protein
MCSHGLFGRQTGSGLSPRASRLTQETLPPLGTWAVDRRSRAERGLGNQYTSLLGLRWCSRCDDPGRS